MTSGLTRRSKAGAGFTLIELLVVLAIMGMITGLAIPELHLIAQRFEYSAKRKNILAEVEGLSYRAYAQGRPYVIGREGGQRAENALPLTLPAGWRVEATQPIRFGFNGVCSGGVFFLLTPENVREAYRLDPPRCAVARPAEPK